MMASPITGERLGGALCEVLGIIPTNVTAIKLECMVGNVALVTITRMVLDRELDELKAVLERYNMVERECP